MDTLELELPDLQLSDDDEIKYCHILCCHPTITLCGAYKPVQCGVFIINKVGQFLLNCPVCKRKGCPDCYNLVYRECPRCNE